MGLLDRSRLSSSNSSTSTSNGPTACAQLKIGVKKGSYSLNQLTPCKIQQASAPLKKECCLDNPTYVHDEEQTTQTSNLPLPPSPNEVNHLNDLQSETTLEFTNEIHFEPIKTDILSETKQSPIIDGHSSNTASEEDIKLKTYKGDRRCKLRLLVWFIALLAAGLLMAVASFFFIRYSHENHYERLINADYDVEMDRLSNAEILLPFYLRDITMSRDLLRDELRDLVNKSFIQINKTIEKIDFYYINQVSNQTYEALIDVTVKLPQQNPNNSIMRSLNNSTSKSLRFLEHYEKSLKSLNYTSNNVLLGDLRRARIKLNQKNNNQSSTSMEQTTESSSTEQKKEPSSIEQAPELTSIEKATSTKPIFYHNIEPTTRLVPSAIEIQVSTIEPEVEQITTSINTLTTEKIYLTTSTPELASKMSEIINKQGLSTQFTQNLMLEETTTESSSSSSVRIETTTQPQTSTTTKTLETTLYEIKIEPSTTIQTSKQEILMKESSTNIQKTEPTSLPQTFSTSTQSNPTVIVNNEEATFTEAVTTTVATTTIKLTTPKPTAETTTSPIKINEKIEKILTSNVPETTSKNTHEEIKSFILTSSPETTSVKVSEIITTTTQIDDTTILAVDTTIKAEQTTKQSGEELSSTTVSLKTSTIEVPDKKENKSSVDFIPNEKLDEEDNETIAMKSSKIIYSNSKLNRIYENSLKLKQLKFYKQEKPAISSTESVSSSTVTPITSILTSNDKIQLINHSNNVQSSSPLLSTTLVDATSSPSLSTTLVDATSSPSLSTTLVDATRSPSLSTTLVDANLSKISKTIEKIPREIEVVFMSPKKSKNIFKNFMINKK